MVWHKPWLDEMIKARHVVLMAKPSAQAASVMMDHPDLAVVPLHRAERGKKNKHDGFIGFFRMVMAMRAVRADEIWILHKSWRYAVAAMLAGIPKRAGYGFGKQKFALNHGQPLSENLKKAHPRETVSAFTAQFGISPSNTHPIITPDAESRKMASALVPVGRYIVMGVGAADAIRRWSPGRFAELIAKLRTSHPEVGIVICGSPAEAVIGDAIMAGLPSGIHPPQLMFDQSVKTVIAVHEKATLYIGNDTSLINIAAAVGRNCIRIFASNLSVLSSPLIETHLPRDPARMDVIGAIDDIDASRIHHAATAYLDR